MAWRVIRIISPYIVSFLAPLAIFYCKLLNVGESHYDNIMSATITLGAIGVGFLAASITLLPSVGNSSFVGALKRIGAYKKLLRDLVHAIVLLFTLSIFSVVGVFIGNGQHVSPFEHVVSVFFVYTWSYLFALVVIICTIVIRLFLRVLFLSSDEE